jgi:hypothetical protein
MLHLLQGGTVANTVKAVIEVRPQVWRALKAIAAEEGKPVQAKLGEMVAREVQRDMRAKERRLGKRKAAKVAMDKALAEIRASQPA